VRITALISLDLLNAVSVVVPLWQYVFSHVSDTIVGNSENYTRL